MVEIDPAGTRKWLHADERGSIVAASDGSGNLVAGSITGTTSTHRRMWLPVGVAGAPDCADWTQM